MFLFSLTICFFGGEIDLDTLLDNDFLLSFFTSLIIFFYLTGEFDLESDRLVASFFSVSLKFLLSLFLEIADFLGGLTDLETDLDLDFFLPY